MIVWTVPLSPTFDQYFRFFFKFLQFLKNFMITVTINFWPVPRKNVLLVQRYTWLSCWILTSFLNFQVTFECWHHFWTPPSLLSLAWTSILEHLTVMSFKIDTLAFSSGISLVVNCILTLPLRERINVLLIIRKQGELLWRGKSCVRSRNKYQSMKVPWTWREFWFFSGFEGKRASIYVIDSWK